MDDLGLDFIDLDSMEYGFHESGGMCCLNGVLPPPTRITRDVRSMGDIEGYFNELGF